MNWKYEDDYEEEGPTEKGGFPVIDPTSLKVLNKSVISKTEKKKRKPNHI